MIEKLDLKILSMIYSYTKNNAKTYPSKLFMLLYTKYLCTLDP